MVSCSQKKFYKIGSRAFGSIRVNRLFIENNRIVTIDRNAFAGIEENLVIVDFFTVRPIGQIEISCEQSYKHFMSVNYDP